MDLILVWGAIIILVALAWHFVQKKIDWETELIYHFDRERKTISDRELKQYYDWFLEIGNQFPYDIMLELCVEEIKTRKKND